MPGPARPDAWLSAVLAPHVSPAALAAAEAEGSVWAGLVRQGALGDDDIVRALAARFHLPVADLRRAEPRAAALLPERWARRFDVVPLRLRDGVLEVATSSPHDVDSERALAFACGHAVSLMVAAPSAIAACRDRVYGHGAARSQEEGSAASEPGATLLEVAGPRGADAEIERPIIRIVDELLHSAAAARASDLHLERDETAVVVRFRVDGILREQRVLPRELAGSLVSRIKIMAGLDISDRLRPQDGRARIIAAGRAVDLRVSTLPAASGEKVVIRLLESDGSILSLDRIGLAAEELARLRTLLSTREGLLLVTGPTGSGKTTTLYAALRALQSEGVNIVTVEDPVEYRLPGTVQVQVHERAGLGFAAALRSILRQDPDVILVGEIRDPETAGIAIQAALTGHLVLATLHTPDAPTAVTRLADMGIEGYKLAAALRGVVAQRLVRRLCARCGSGTEAARRVAELAPGGATLAGAGAPSCRECGGSGFRGRLAIAEVLVTGAAVGRAIARGAPSAEIGLIAREEGFRPMWISGMGRVARNETTAEEVARVVSPPE